MSMNDGLVNATVPEDAGEPVYLKSLEGAWIQLKPLPYGQLIERRDKASRMSMAADTRRGQDAKLDIDMLQAQSRVFEFNHCIIEHNLSDGHGNKLNFSNPATLSLLDPKVGQEIERLIDNLNQLEDIDEENFSTVPSSSSMITEKELKDISDESS